MDIPDNEAPAILKDTCNEQVRNVQAKCDVKPTTHFSSVLQQQILFCN